MRMSFCVPACYALGLAALWGQTPSGPVIRTETRLVLVDAVVTDKHGQYIRDLKLNNFRLWDDGKEQTVTNLTYVSDAASPWHSERQYIALFFDDSSVTVSGQLDARNAIMKWLEANAGSGTVFAVFDYGLDVRLTQNFTANPRLLKNAVAHTPGGAIQRGSSGNLSLPAGSTSGRGRRLLLRLRDVARSMAGIPGRKTLVLVSSGFAADPGELDETIRAMNRADVAVYPLKPGGQRNVVMESMENAPPGLADFGGRPNDIDLGATLMSLAKDTGGFFAPNATDLFTQFGKIASERNEYYLLSYAAPESSTGSCHSLRVKAGVSGVNVRARNSYCNNSSLDQLAGTPAGHDLDQRIASGEPGQIAAALKLPYFYTGANTARVNVTLDIPRSALEFQKQRGKLHSVVNLMGLACAADSDKVIARFSDQIAVEAGEKAEVEALATQPLHYENQLEIPPGEYKFKLAFASGGNAFGKLELPLSIKPLNGQPFMLSSLALSKELHRAEEPEALLLDGRTPLVVSGMQIVPAAAYRFQATDRVTAYLEIFSPAMTGLNPPGYAFELKVLEAGTGLKRVDSGWLPWKSQDAANPVTPVGLNVMVESLTAGKYRVEVQVTNTAGAKPELRTAEFEVQ